MRVERDGREEQREGDHEHDDEEHECVRRLFMWKARSECQCSDAEASAEGDEAEVTGCRLDGAIPMHLKCERPDGHEQPEHQDPEDGEGRGQDQNAKRSRPDCKRRREEVVRGLVEPHVQNE